MLEEVLSGFFSKMEASLQDNSSGKQLNNINKIISSNEAKTPPI